MKALSFLLIFVFLAACAKAPKNPETCTFIQSSNNYFNIQDNSDSPGRAYNVFCKKVLVFGLVVYGTCEVTDDELLHAANVLPNTLIMMRMGSWIISLFWIKCLNKKQY